MIVNPSVVPVGKRTEVTLIPLEGRYLFDEAIRYKISVYPMTRPRRLASAEPDALVGGKSGMLTFEYLFDNEEEYDIRVLPENETDKAKIIAISVYALNDDLFMLRPLKGDMHIHTNRSDGKEDPAVVAANYRKYGFDFISITDHNRYFGSLEAQKAYREVPIDLNILNGEEVHTPGSNLHIVHVGGKKSVTELYVKEREKFESEVAELEKTVPGGEYARRMAEAAWAVSKIHDAGGLAILPHPFWIKNVYNLSLEFLKILFYSGLFDAYELIGSMKTNGCNLSVAYFHELQKNGFDMPIVGSSDAHSTVGYAPFADYFTVVFANDNTCDSIIKAIRDSRTAVVEYVPLSGQSEYRVYGSFRLVMLTRFLIDNYFDRTLEMLSTEGEMMREYLIGIKGTAEILTAMHGRAEEFYRFFYGKAGSGYVDLIRYGDVYRKYNKVWVDYGVTRRGSAIDPVKAKEDK